MKQCSAALKFMEHLQQVHLHKVTNTSMRISDACQMYIK